MRPSWREEGPGPLAMPEGVYSIATGAIEALAADPLDQDRVFVATVGGGIWASTNASAQNPTWTPLTDQAAALSMSAIAFSPLDPNRNTLYAGSGRTSHSLPLVGPNGGPTFGLLKTIDGGLTWFELARNVFAGDTVTKILPTSLTVPPGKGPKKPIGQVVLAGTVGGGLLRSVDSGRTWKKVAGISAPVTDVVVEPGTPSRIYVAGAGHLYRSEDGGDQNWTDITPAAWNVVPGWATVKLSPSPLTDGFGNHWLYAAVALWVHGFGLFFTPDRGVTWHEAGKPLDGSLPAPPIAASPLKHDVVFCCTDAGSPDHYMVVAADGLAAQWTSIEGAGANGTGPHTDARDCAFSAEQNLLFEVNDGGIYALLNAHGLEGIDQPPRQWQPAVGNLRTAEFNSIAYDSVNKIIFGATQDNSIPQQTTPGGLDWKFNEKPWGDGFQVGVDTTSSNTSATHYSSQQNLGFMVLRSYTSPTTPSPDHWIGLIVKGTCGVEIHDFETNLTDDGGAYTIQWNNGFAVNRVDGSRLLIGTYYLYESSDRGETLTSLGGLALNSKSKWIPTNPVGLVTAYAYGHPLNADVIYIGAGGQLRLRTGNSGLPSVVATYPGSTPFDIALDTNDWHHAYVLDDQGRVWRTVEAGATAGGWTNLTGNLPGLTGDLRTIQVLPRQAVGGREVVFVGGYRGVFVTVTPGGGEFAFWRKHGTNFPNAITTDIDYSAVDRLMVAGTLGRAAWSLADVPSTIVGAPWLVIKASYKRGCLGGWLENSLVTFSPDVHGIGDLVQPLSYAWSLSGAATTAPLDSVNLPVTMPAAGGQVVVELTITDAEGYAIHAVVADRVLTVGEVEASFAFCDLIAKLKTYAMINWPINPLGPDVGPGFGKDLRPSYAEVRQLATDLAAVARRLLDLGDLKE